MVEAHTFSYAHLSRLLADDDPISPQTSDQGSPDVGACGNEIALADPLQRLSQTGRAADYEEIGTAFCAAIGNDWHGSPAQRTANRPEEVCRACAARRHHGAIFVVRSARPLPQDCALVGTPT